MRLNSPLVTQGCGQTHSGKSEDRDVLAARVRKVCCRYGGSLGLGLGLAGVTGTCLAPVWLLSGTSGSWLGSVGL